MLGLFHLDADGGTFPLQFLPKLANVILYGEDALLLAGDGELVLLDGEGRYVDPDPRVSGRQLVHQLVVRALDERVVDFRDVHPLEGLLRLFVGYCLNLVQGLLDALLRAGDGDRVAIIVRFRDGNLGCGDLLQFLKLRSSFA